MPRYSALWDAETQTRRLVQYTAEEETARDADEANNIAVKAARQAATAKTATDRATGKDKLVAAGTITQDEADALFS